MIVVRWVVGKGREMTGVGSFILPRSEAVPVYAPADRERSCSGLLPSTWITAGTLCHCCFYLVQVSLRDHASRQHLSHKFVDQSSKKVDLCAFRGSIFAWAFTFISHVSQPLRNYIE
jgi:hypothetical protein